MANKLILSAQYISDMKALAEFYTKVSKGTATSIVSQINSGVALLLDCPEMGKLISEKESKGHRLLIKGGYVIIYQFENNEVTLLTLLDHRQDYSKYI